MNKKKLIILLTIGVIITGVGAGYYLLWPLLKNTKLDEPAPTISANQASSPTIGALKPATKEAPLVKREHAVEGKALLIDNAGQKTLRFENLKTVNGPDLHIYLSADIEARDYIDLGTVRAVQGNVNYTIPTDTDTVKYHYALIWCKTFKVLFSSAEF